MTPTGWVALAVLALGSLLPASPAVRLRALSVGGRLRMPDGSRAWTVPRLPGSLPSLAGLAVVGLVIIVAGPALGLAAGVLLGLAIVLARDRTRRRRAAALDRDVLTAVRVLVGELEAGSQAPAALEAAASATAPPVAETFRAAASAAAAGGAAGAELVAAGGALRRVGIAWQLGETTGLALTGVLGRVAAELSAVEEQRRTVAVALAGPRSSALVLSMLPVLGVALGAAMGARPLPFLLATPAGRLVCCAGVILDACGVLWMRRLLHTAERA